ncbi:MAG TPA: heavy-metal-associated domain-containing protein [Sediminispirochaeta sp.]|nr:heavy-metal-associated domain-containing protein [Sediminispirochaeta sp.]
MKTTRYLDLQGAHCASCAYSIERIGRKMNGVSDVRVDTSASRVEVSFADSDEDQQRSSLEKIIQVVRRLGYDAAVAE